MCDEIGTPEFDAIHFEDDVDMAQRLSAPKPTIYDSIIPNPYLGNNSSSDDSNGSSSSDD
ncbi:MAG: hypothetical protein J5656_00635 [Clostridia bacterium]|nr:hypothetical protein [Clostridia bacterium]